MEVRLAYRGGIGEKVVHFDLGVRKGPRMLCLEGTFKWASQNESDFPRQSKAKQRFVKQRLGI